MSRKSRRDTLFGLKVLAISSAVVFMAAGVSGIYQDTKDSKVTSFSAKGVRIKTVHSSNSGEYHSEARACVISTKTGNDSMKKIKRYISKNWLWIIAGLLLMVSAVKIAYKQRGYVAYGGEWLILPLILMGAELVNNIGDAIGYLLTWEDDNGRD